MSEVATGDGAGLRVSRVEPQSAAARAGIAEGDVILSVDGAALEDVIDFRYYTAEERFDLGVRRDGSNRRISLHRDFGEDVGIEFLFELTDSIHTCDNKCVFCFIHQMPKGMRKSLYLMDDDYRLSFLHGNYVTLTNMDVAEFERIKEQRLSPIYVSIHATDPGLRAFMLGRTELEPILPRLRDLIDHGIQVHTQVVLCPGLNDGPALDETIASLADLYPGVSSVAVVPVGLSKFRHNLYPIRRVDGEYSKALLRQLAVHHRRLKQSLGTRFVFASDEWFFCADRPIPSTKWYEDFPQLEDGVGTCRLFLDGMARGSKSLPARADRQTELTLLTGVLPCRVIERLATKLREVEGLTVRVVAIENDFFGRGINVAGLLTYEDIVKKLDPMNIGGIVAVPDVALKDGNLFLDDKTVDDLRSATGLDVRACPSRADKFLQEWLPALISV